MATADSQDKMTITRRSGKEIRAYMEGQRQALALAEDKGLTYARHITDVVQSSICQDVVTDQKIAYLFGAVSGRIAQAAWEFAQAETVLMKRGYIVWNPLTRANTPEAAAEERELGAQAAGKPGWQSALTQCFKDVCEADELWAVNDWRASTGGCCELFIAQVIGTPAYDFVSGAEIKERLELTHYWIAEDLGKSRLVWPTKHTERDS